MTARHLTVAPGPAAVEALAGLLVEAKDGDPLARATVVAPSSHAAATLRRRLAALGAPLVNVAFLPLAGVAQRLLPAAARPPAAARLNPLVRGALVRQVLAGHRGGLLGGLEGPALERSLEATFAELDEVGPEARRALAGASARAAEVVALHERYRAGADAFTSEHDVVGAALAALADGSADVGAVGPLVAFLPRRLAGARAELVEALARRTPVVVVGAEAGAPRTGPAPTLVTAPDPEEEVRVAVRAVLDHLATGEAERVAVVARVAQPHLLLLHERLVAAGVPHHGRSPLALGQSVAGRTLLGLLRLPTHAFRRADLARWLRVAPLRGPGGEPLDAARLDRTARRAGASAGVARWRERLDRRADELARRLADADQPRWPGEEVPADRRARIEESVADLAELRATFEWLVELATPPPGATWADHAAWARAGLAALLGEPGEGAGWPAAEVAAYEEVVAALDQLAALDRVAGGGPVDAAQVRRVLTDELARPGRRIGRPGRGVFVGSLADLRGADHDLVVVVGVAEGRHPPAGRDDPLLPDRERGRAGGELGLRRAAAADEREDHELALASAPRVVLSWARADTRAGREAHPARWWLAERPSGGEREGPGPGGGEREGGPAGPGRLVDLPSFVTVPERGGTASDDTEARVAGLLAARRRAGPAGVVAALALAAEAEGDPAPARSARSLGDRLDGVLSAWTGAVGVLPADAPGGVGDPPVGSATRFEQWATCPFRYLLRHVLGVRAPDERGDADVISNPDRGSLVHEVLERFHGEDLGRDPAVAFEAADLERLADVARSVGDRFRDEGRTGRPLLWRLESEALARRLESIAAADVAHRAERGVSPVAVEHLFGDERGVVAPVRVELSGGREVAFRGSVDRIDRSPDGQRVVVLDYKTGSDRGYSDLPRAGKGPAADLTCRGRHLQLPLYAEAARQLLAAEGAGDEADVEAYFWFLDQSPPGLRGGPVGEAERDRLRQVLEVIVGGIEAGRFPANPGEDGWFGPAHCGFCPYDRVCPPSRVDRWEALRRDPALATYVELAEGPR